MKGSTAIAQGKADPNFETYFIANTGTGLTMSKEFPKQIAGKTFTFGSKGSTSGRLMPEYHIRKYFKNASEVFSRVGLWKPLQNGGAGSVWRLRSQGDEFQGLEKGIKNGTIDPKKSVIWKTPGYLTTTGRSVAMSTIHTGPVSSLIGAAVDEGSGSVDSFPREAFIPADNLTTRRSRIRQKS